MSRLLSWTALLGALFLASVPVRSEVRVTVQQLTDASLVYRRKPGTPDKAFCSDKGEIMCSLPPEFCVGYHLGKNFYVTRAHCVVDNNGAIVDPDHLEIVGVGEVDVKIHLHKDYKEPFGPDIAWVEYENPAFGKYTLEVDRQGVTECEMFKLSATAAPSIKNAQFRWIRIADVGPGTYLTYQRHGGALMSKVVDEDVEHVLICKQQSSGKYMLHYIYYGRASNFTVLNDCHFMECQNSSEKNRVIPKVNTKATRQGGLTVDQLTDASLVYRRKAGTSDTAYCSESGDVMCRLPDYCVGYHVGKNYFVTRAHCVVDGNGTIYDPDQLDIVGLGPRDVKIFLHKDYSEPNGPNIAWIAYNDTAFGKYTLDVDTSAIGIVLCDEFVLDVDDSAGSVSSASYQWKAKPISKEATFASTFRKGMQTFTNVNKENAEHAYICLRPKTAKSVLHYIFYGVTDNGTFVNDCHTIQCHDTTEQNMIVPAIHVFEVTDKNDTKSIVIVPESVQIVVKPSTQKPVTTTRSKPRTTTTRTKRPSRKSHNSSDIIYWDSTEEGYEPRSAFAQWLNKKLKSASNATVNKPDESFFKSEIWVKPTTTATPVKPSDDMANEPGEGANADGSFKAPEERSGFREMYAESKKTDQEQTKLESTTDYNWSDESSLVDPVMDSPDYDEDDYKKDEVLWDWSQSGKLSSTKKCKIFSKNVKGKCKPLGVNRCSCAHGMQSNGSTELSKPISTNDTLTDQQNSTETTTAGSGYPRVLLSPIVVILVVLQVHNLYL